MSALRLALQKLIADVLAEQQASTTSASPGPEAGTVTSVNDDGSVNVQTSSSNYASVGAATTDVQVIGALVMVITGDGRLVAVPR